MARVTKPTYARVYLESFSLISGVLLPNAVSKDGDILRKTCLVHAEVGNTEDKNIVSSTCRRHFFPAFSRHGSDDRGAE